MSVKQKNTVPNLDQHAVEHYAAMTVSYLEGARKDCQEIADANRQLIEGTAPFATTRLAYAMFWGAIVAHLKVTLDFGSGEKFEFDGTLDGLFLGGGTCGGVATVSVPLNQLKGLHTNVQLTTGGETIITWREGTKIIGSFYGVPFGTPGVLYGNGTFKKI